MEPTRKTKSSSLGVSRAQCAILVDFFSMFLILLSVGMPSNGGYFGVASHSILHLLYPRIPNLEQLLCLLNTFGSSYYLILFGYPKEMSESCRNRFLPEDWTHLRIGFLNHECPSGRGSKANRVATRVHLGSPMLMPNSCFPLT